MFIYLIRLSDRLHIVLPAAAQRKIRYKETRYLMADARVNARKYKDFEAWLSTN